VNSIVTALPGLEALNIDAPIHVSGTGRIGTQVIMALAEAGVKNVSANDPQTIDQESLAALVHTRRSDLGRAKAIVLERFLDGRSNLVFEPVVACTESHDVDPYFRKAKVILSCSNTFTSRVTAERKSDFFGKPCVQVAALDSKLRLGGVIIIRTPETASWAACFGCLTAGINKFRRGESLQPTVTATLGALGANLALQIISGQAKTFLREHNAIFVDLESYRLETLAIERRPSCWVCRRRK
jgi:molybdopterin/thiamine biosynthesis adenylyltransferase